MARIVANRLERFVTLNRLQLAGHGANLDFWIAEALHALEVVDGLLHRVFHRERQPMWSFDS